jgi:hypothetical protein
VFERLRTEDFYYSISLVLRIKKITTHKGEISLSNLSGYGLAILGATPNISSVYQKHVDNDMRTVEASDHLRRIWTLGVTASRNFSTAKMSGCRGPQLAILRKPKDRRNEHTTSKIRLARLESTHMTRSQNELLTCRYTYTRLQKKQR